MTEDGAGEASRDVHKASEPARTEGTTVLDLPASRDPIPSNKGAIKSINRELSRQYRDQDPPPLVSFGQLGHDVQHLGATIVGVEGTPYDGGVFFLNIKIPDSYPHKPPKVTFTTRIYHPNVASDGRIGIDILRDQWHPAWRIESVLIAIQSVLGDPLTNSPCINIGARDVYLHDRERYEKTAKDWTRKYAV